MVLGLRPEAQPDEDKGRQGEVDSGTETGGPDTLRHGDAILFALGTDRWAPGTRVSWDDRAYAVAGVLGVERLEVDWT